jgi:Ca2+-binding RTX toxin-like protein
MFAGLLLMFDAAFAVKRADRDAIFGLDGNDRLQGLAGNDRLDGGNGFDRAIYTDATGPVTVNLAAGTGGGAGITSGFSGCTGTPS